LNSGKEDKALHGSGNDASRSLPEGDELSGIVAGAGQSERPQLVRLKNEISTRVKQEPASASRLVQSWLKDSDR
jgi:hypothetical protein